MFNLFDRESDKGMNGDTTMSDVENVIENDSEIDAVNEIIADEPVENADRLKTESGTVAKNATTEQVENSEQLKPNFEIPEPLPWDDVPKDVYFYEKIYEDGHLGSRTESAEQAYKMGWDIEHNYIPIADTEQSDVNGWIYRKELCPHKSERELQIEGWNREIFELKEELNRTDYRAIKYAEGVLTDEEYHETGIQRQVWRRRINELERLIAG